MDPNCKILKEGNENGEGSEVEMFGIKISIDEGSTKGFLSIEDIAKRTHTSIKFIENILKKFGLMTEDGEWSKEEYIITNCTESERKGNTSPFQTSSIIMYHLSAPPKGKDIKDCKMDDWIDLGIHVHEQFILQLMKKIDRTNQLK